MSAGMPTVKESDLEAVASHPAVLAYRTITGSGALPTQVATLKPPHRKSAVYRLSGLEEGESIVAKRTSLASVRYEEAVYIQVLARLPVRTPRLVGAIADVEDEGWLLLEDVGDRALDFGSERHRKLAGAWLARLHTLTSNLESVERLPSRADDYYLSQLVSARQNLQRGRDHARVDSDHKARLVRIESALDRLEASWTAISAASRVLPPTLVHGDFVSKNVRIQSRSSGDEDVLPVDWEIAGYGTPAADLEHIDLESYLCVADVPALTIDSLREISRAGRVFRLVLEVLWASRSLETPWPDRALNRYFPTYETWLWRAVAWAEEA